MNIAGIGSRKTPEEALIKIDRISRILTLDGHTLFSGDADGPDYRFRVNWLIHEKAKAHIMLPWRSFNAHTRTKFDESFTHLLDDEQQTRALKILHDSGVCTYQDKLGGGVLRLFARNVAQVLTLDLSTPVDVVLYYAPLSKQGKVTGGTAIAVKLAMHLGIPTFNIYVEEELIAFLYEHIDKHHHEFILNKGELNK